MTLQRPPFQIRKAGAGDAAGILACLDEAFRRYQEEYTPGAFADTVLDSQTLAQRMRSMCVFVAVASREVIGTIACEANGPEGHLRGMAVSPEWQGAGLALDLLRAAEEQLRQEGCAFVSLDTTQPLRRAIRFYEKNGFSPSGQTSDFFGMPLYQFLKWL